MSPCHCCAEEFWKANDEARQEIMERCSFSFVYKDQVFHVPDCPEIKELLYYDLLGTAYYETCIRKNLIPCAVCRPTAKNALYRKKGTQKAVSHSVPKLVEIGKAKVYTTRELSGEEKRAIARYHVANRERAMNESKLQYMTAQEQRDAHTLTQTRFSFWAAIGYKTFHLRECKKLYQISNLKGFSKYSDAIRAGYQPCKICRPSPKKDIAISVPIYQQQRDNKSIEHIDWLCEHYGYKHSFNNHRYYIETEVGKWMMITISRPVALFHINKIREPGNTENYHRQERLYLSLTDTIEYIRRHDDTLKSRIAEGKKN